MQILKSTKYFKWSLILNIILIILISAISSIIKAQDNYNKIGGVGFRVDDNQAVPSTYLIPYVNLFNSKGMKFTYSVNLGRASAALLEYLPQMQNAGHEIADHSPDHNTKYFRVEDASPYLSDPGVDHIIGSSEPQTVCLKIDLDRINISTYTGEGRISIAGDIVTANLSNEFENLSSGTLKAIYIPLLNSCYSFSSENVTGDHIFDLKSFWGEDIDINISDVEYHNLDVCDVYYTPQALQLLAKRTQEFCNLQTGILKPTSWIQPGGEHPMFHPNDLKNALGSLGYTSGGVGDFCNTSLACYNEYDPDNDKRFGINWGDFNEERNPLSTLKNEIANRFAKHYVSIGHSHLQNQLGTWQDYLDRTGALLDWCIQKGIPVRTYSEWAEQLYNTHQNPYVNVMPKLENDLDEDGNPDGFSLESYVSLDTTDGPNSEFRYSLTKNASGYYFCRILRLGGIEKDTCSFSFWIKGDIGTMVRVEISFNSSYSTNDRKIFDFAVQNTGWQEYSLFNSTSANKDLIIPLDCNFIDVNISGGTGTTKVAGFSLRKSSLTTIIPAFLNTPAYSSNSIALQWIDNSNNEMGFRIKRKVQGEINFTEIISLPDNSVSSTDLLLDIPTALLINDSLTIYYFVEAFNGTDSIKSNIDSVRIASENVFPVELNSFIVKVYNNQVTLNWITETEVNNYGFEVERKSDNAIWKKIAFVEGHGNSNSPKEYSYTDNKPIGGSKFQYRLKQIDNDGQFEYSNVVEVELVPIKYALYQNFPNPFNPVTNIRYQLPNKSKVVMKIYNILGSEVMELLSEQKESGVYETEFDAKALSSGTYFYRMTAGSFIETKKMILLK